MGPCCSARTSRTGLADNPVRDRLGTRPGGLGTDLGTGPQSRPDTAQGALWLWQRPGLTGEARSGAPVVERRAHRPPRFDRPGAWSPGPQALRPRNSAGEVARWAGAQTWRR